MRTPPQFALGLTLLAIVCSLSSTEAIAGQYKTLNTETLATGEKLRVLSNPKNTGSAMELDVYEWRTLNGVAGWYTCDILDNNTGQVLAVKLLGVDGSMLGQCFAESGAHCSTPAFNLWGNLKFLCIVSTSHDAPVAGTLPTYRLSVSRHGAQPAFSSSRFLSDSERARAGVAR